MIKVITETPRVHYIGYLYFYYNTILYDRKLFFDNLPRCHSSFSCRTNKAIYIVLPFYTKSYSI
jgi:hypothetical protein